MKATRTALPSSGPAREALRAKGQFRTPDWIADAMVAYVLNGTTNHLFDPAVGGGAFFHAAKAWASAHHQPIALLGCEVDLSTQDEALATGLNQEDLQGIDLTDFVLNPPNGPYKAIVANPPYIRHHRLTAETKQCLRALGTNLIGKPLDGRAGYHIFFLLQALRLLDHGGRLAFIIPADSFEGVFAARLWRWITDSYRLDAVITFAPDATPFPRIDTNPVIVLIRREKPASWYWWARCNKADTLELTTWVGNGIGGRASDGLIAVKRNIDEGILGGLSREPMSSERATVLLGDVASVMRGIATGANEFFFLTSRQVEHIGIPIEFVERAVGRTRDVVADVLGETTLRQLDKNGRPTYLFCPDGRPLAEFPSLVQEYLKKGEASGFPERPLIRQRRPWYKMERRTPPPILFAYLGRRNTRFILNTAGVVPLTGFLCIYPKKADREFVNCLWRLLSEPDVLANLGRVGKTYGDGAIKVEPRSLERLPIPNEIVHRLGLLEMIDRQEDLAFH